MRIARTVAEARAARAGLGRLALVPTMGALHDGHLSLIAAARQQAGAVAASIFVNPAQFGPDEDFHLYPRPIEADLAKLEAAGCDLAFVPGVADLYPTGFDTRIEVGAIADRLEGAVRPGHFAGVATVVAKLFAILTPDIAIFGQKDVQQTRVIGQMVRDLDLPVRIVVAPIRREADGLALSSRNAYLSAADRAAAVSLYRGLTAVERAYAKGEYRATALRRMVETEIGARPIDYISIADPDTLVEIEEVGPVGAIVSLAVRFGTTRLLDNIALGPAGAGVS